MRYVRAFRSLHRAALFLCKFYVIYYFLSDNLTRSQYRYSRRIAHNKFTAYLSHTLAQWKTFFLGIERFLWTVHHFWVNIFLTEQTTWIPLISSPDFGKCNDQSFQFLRAVADGKVGKNISDISKFNLNVVFIT